MVSWWGACAQARQGRRARARCCGGRNSRHQSSQMSTYSSWKQLRHRKRRPDEMRPGHRIAAVPGHIPKRAATQSIVQANIPRLFFCAGRLAAPETPCRAAFLKDGCAKQNQHNPRAARQTMPFPSGTYRRLPGHVARVGKNNRDALESGDAGLLKGIPHRGNICPRARKSWMRSGIECRRERSPPQQRAPCPAAPARLGARASSGHRPLSAPPALGPPGAGHPLRDSNLQSSD